MNFAMHPPSVHVEKFVRMGHCLVAGMVILLWRAMTTWGFPPSQNIIRCNRQASIQLNFSITCACKMDMFDSRSCFPLSMELETGQTHRWMLPYSFCVNYYSPTVAVHLYIYPIASCLRQWVKSCCLGRLRTLERRSSYAGMECSSN